MPFDRFNDDTCPKCHKPISQATVERHPTRRDLAIHNFACARCGIVKTKVLFRRPAKPSLKLVV
jgi:hypothetical protein